MRNGTILASDRDRFWLALAQRVAKFSNDPYTQVGCVIVNNRGTLISAGYNSVPGCLDVQSLSREAKNRVSIHAEHHALKSTVRSAAGGTAYLWPVEPCGGCAERLTQANIGRIVAPIDASSEVYVRWQESLRKSRAHLDSQTVTRQYAPMGELMTAIETVRPTQLTAYLEALRRLWLK